MSFKKTLLFGSAIMAVGFLAAQTTQRTPLYETFTSSTCPPCAPGNAHLEGLFAQPENDGKFTSLKYQMSWPGSGDPYYTGEGGTRRGFYSVSSVPRLEIDAGYDGNPSGLSQGDMDDAYAVPAIVELEALYSVDIPTKTVTIHIKAKALQEIESGGGLFLHCAIFENLTSGNIKSNGETEFINVMKKMVPGVSGTYLGSLDADEIVEFDFSYTFNGDYILPPNASSPVNHAVNHTVEEFGDLGVLVWVQRNSTHEVYQSAYALQGTVSTTEYKVDPIEQLSVYPNPASEITQVIYTNSEKAGDATISIFDNAGKLVFEKIMLNQGTETTTVKIDTKDFDNGIYFVKVNTAEGQKTKKLSVMH